MVKIKKLNGNGENIFTMVTKVRLLGCRGHLGRNKVTKAVLAHASKKKSKNVSCIL